MKKKKEKKEEKNVGGRPRLSEKSVRRMIVFPGPMMRMIDVICKRRGTTNFSEAVKYCVSETFYRPKPAERKIADHFKIDNLPICDELGGEVVSKNNKQMCQYYTYFNKKRFLNEVSVDALSDDMIKNQYQPSKEKVMKLQMAGKVDYPVAQKENE